MDNFKVIYKILKQLEVSLDYEHFNASAISAERLGVTNERREQLLIMLQDEGYIAGIVCVQDLVSGRRQIAEPVNPTITIKGLEYLSENSLMKKAANLLKGIKDIVPGV